MKKFMAGLLIAGLVSTSAYAANTKVTGLTADTSPATDSIMYTVDDPGGTAVSRKSTIGEVLSAGTNLSATGAVEGAVDITTSDFTTGGQFIVDIDGTAPGAAGSLTVGLGSDGGLYHDGTNTVLENITGDLRIFTDGAGGTGIEIDAEDDTIAFLYSGAAGADLALDGMNVVTGDSYQINNTSVLNATTLGTGVVTTSATTVGALDSGSITSNFGTIDNGASAITTTGVITGGTVEATTDTASADNAAIGYTAAEGLILTGQGSTNDITIKNDADVTVISIPTGTESVEINATLTAASTHSLSLTPTTTLAADETWHGVHLDGANLDPTGTGADIVGMEVDFSGVSVTNLPVVQGLRLDVPFGSHALNIEEGILEILSTVPSTAASEFEILEINVDSSALVATSSVHAIDVATTGTPSGKIYALTARNNIEAVNQQVVTFTTPSQTEFAGEKTGGGVTWADGVDASEIFVANSDEVYVGSAAQFAAIEVIMTTAGTKTLQPTFHYNTAADTWTEFFPSDLTDGFQQSGDITWELGDISATWTGDGDPGAADSTAGYWIKIIRTRVADPGTPTPTTMKTGTVVEYTWDKTGVIDALGFTIGNAAILEAELEILDGLTITTAELETLSDASNADSLHVHASAGLSGIVNADLSGSAGITSANILDNTIANADMADNSIDSDDYVDGSIDAAHLAPDVIAGQALVTAVATDMVLLWDATDSALKRADASDFGGAETNSLEVLTTGIATTEIPIGTAANTVVYAALSGDATMTNGGVVTVVDDLHAHTTTSLSGIVNADLSGTAGITGANIADATIDQVDVDDTDTLAGNPAHGASAAWFGTTGLIFEGLTSNTLEGLLISSDVTADRTWTLPDESGTLVTSATSPFQTTTNVANLVTATDSLTIGSATALAKLAVDGDATGEVGLLVQNVAAQTADILVLEESDGTDFVTVQQDGRMTFGSTGVPKKRVFISASAGSPRTTTGCGDATQVESTTSKINYWGCAFANDADDFWQSTITLPENYDASTFTASIEWTCTASASLGVSWFVQLMSIGNDDALDTAFGTAIEINDDGTATGDFLRTAESAAITASGTPAGGDRLWIQVYRDVSDTDDDLTTDGTFLGIWLTFGVDALSTED